MAVPRRLLPGYGTRSVARQMKGEWSRMLEESVKNSFQEEGRTWPDLSGLKGEERDTAAAFAELRDSLYILCVLNQYAFDHDKPEEVKALLNKALFYRSPVLIERRKKLAASLRCARKHGVVQVLISLLWFLVALIISIYKAFGELGDESTALNLALGLLCGWLPAIIASSLVDQNPSNTFVARAKLQKFLDRVTALDPERYSSATLLMYCGQARRRWHYGCAYAILTDFQTRLKSRERGLVQYYQNGRVVDEKLGDAGLPLWAFNPVEFWQMLSAIFLVGSATMGAVVISFNTPTVGLGCRSGSYLIYGLIATVGFVVEIAGWTALRPRERNPTVLRRRTFVGIRAFLVLLELCNCAWLTFSVIAQTWGIWNTCECRSSNWVMGRGGYLDFGTVETFQTDYIVLPYWIAGTVLGMLPLIAVFTIVYQWCTQSFLGTEDYDKAMRGLRRVRAWKYVFHLSFLHQLTTFGPDKVRSKSLGREFKSVTWTR
ncbi:MAG: hypothetical protein M1814_003792 [Vezdaea aestivalis]|nr:MAG: hypothetical protein M1814_003792 [Vezdaea aestivalis]